MRKTTRILTLLLLLSLLVSAVPHPAAQAAEAQRPSHTPEEMWDNIALRSLAYTGYKVDKLKEMGKLYDHGFITSNLEEYDNGVSEEEKILSKIGYLKSSAWPSDEYPTGTETIPDSTTITGRAPNIHGLYNDALESITDPYDSTSFVTKGLVCASFVSYYLFNYVPNIEGIDTSRIEAYFKNIRYDRTENWAAALSKAAADSATTGVIKYTNAEEGWANLVPGDIIIFTQEDKPSEYKHIAIYAGAKNMYDTKENEDYGEYHYIIHVGNSRGPEISTSEYQARSNIPSKNGIPTEFYHLGGITAPLPEPEPELGGFIVQKESNSQYTSQFFKFNLWRVEADESRTHIGEYSICAGDPGSFGSNKLVFEDLPVGQYVIQEDQTPVDGWTLDSSYHYITAVPYNPDAYYEGYPTVTLTNTLANDGGMSIKVTKQTNTGTGADRGWRVNLYYMGVNDYEWRLIDTKTTAQDAADPSCTFLLSEKELWALCADNYEVTGQFMVMEDQTPVDGWIIDDTQYIFDAKLGGSYTATFTNSACGSMTVSKVNPGGEPISGSTMLLEWSTDGTTWAPVQFATGNPTLGGCSSQALADGCLTTDDTGVITFSGLHPAAQYRLTELTTADGYSLLSEPAYIGLLDEDLQVELTVVNGHTFILPATGVDEISPLIVTGMLLLVIAGSFLFVITGKRPDENILLKGKKQK